MPCFAPMSAWRGPGGSVSFRDPGDGSGHEFLSLPCGGCLGCRARRARDWAIRCALEHQASPVTSWCTLTYTDDALPPTLRKDHLSAWIKRVRSARAGERVRFFASGEYGERTQRAHYHAILFGLHEDDTVQQDKWPYGHVRTDPISAAAIAYVAGYTSKKVGWRLEPRERVDPETGECYIWQPPFVHMSRRPGIGAIARDAYAKSWRKSAIWGGREVPVPRFLHAGWEASATDDQKAALLEEVKSMQVASVERLDRPRLRDGLLIAQAQHQQQAERRVKL